MKAYSILLLLLATACTSASALPTAKITIKVIDETGAPVEGVKTVLAFESPKKAGQGWGTDTKSVAGLTDDKGLFTGQSATSPYVSIGARKDGYYNGSTHFEGFTDISGIMGFRKYKPWNPTVELVLKKKINPIPMYAINMFGNKPEDYPQLPKLGLYIGFDLIANDWVAPYGQGTNGDFLFKVDVDRAVSFDDHDVTLTLQFSNEGDGLIQYKPDSSKGKSDLRLPYNAPTLGYIPEFKRRYENKPEIRRVGVSGNPEYDTNYFFRIRTQKDKDGNVTGGLYGKIHGEITLSNYAEARTGFPYVKFHYYLNPSNNDTNIEFNPEQNLRKNLTQFQEVQWP